MARKYIPPLDTLILLDPSTDPQIHVHTAYFDSKHPILSTPRIRPGYPQASKLVAYILHSKTNGESYYDYHFTIYYIPKVYDVYPESVPLESIINQHESYIHIPPPQPKKRKRNQFTPLL